MEKNDYEQWKEWLNKWNVKYEEQTWHKGVKELTVDGTYCLASIVFDLENNFIRMTAYE
jgi:hypothetical protein